MAQFLRDLNKGNDNSPAPQPASSRAFFPAEEDAIDSAVLKKYEESDDLSAVTYVEGWLLKKIPGVHSCETCSNTMLSHTITSNHMYVFFKESDEEQKLNYVSENFAMLVELAHKYLYKFLNKRGFQLNLEKLFEESHAPLLKKSFQFCEEHDRVLDFLHAGSSFLIFKYCTDRNKTGGKSTGHDRKMTKFVQSRSKKRVVQSRSKKRIVK
ncbi:hypothetical protein QAD02_020654 [Eretmocerus hayati]|uniref:Uncharacterized protein n=1 Tax=Eretmocerus hayati TaxID=131215 RepID=A0ACC2PN06_9HYME|nr:hypothetical protein QAD02_020654 [Eretmocerus hayati]